MSYKLMDVALPVYGEKAHKVYEIEITLSAPGVSDWYLVPVGVNGILMTLYTSNKFTFGTIVTTTNRLKTIRDNPLDIRVTPWTDGDISCQIQNSIPPVTAFRLKFVRTLTTGFVELSARSQ